MRNIPEPIAVGEYPRLPIYRVPGFSTFAAYDIETTGLSPACDSIIEIGAVKVVDGVISDNEQFIFSTLVHPYKNRIRPEITRITGITNEDVKNSPEMWDAFSAFADFIGEEILIGFNNTRFDDRFIERAGRYANRIITNKSFDVLTYSRKFKQLLGVDNLKLGTLSLKLGIENPHSHRAVFDALTTARVYLKLLELENLI